VRVEIGESFMQADKRLEAISPHPKPPSEASADRQFFVSYGLIISARLADVEKIRAAIQEEGGKIAFQTVTTALLYVLRHFQIERAIQGDLSELAELHKKKLRRVEG
jgi:hypothetical protein